MAPERSVLRPSNQTPQPKSPDEQLGALPPVPHVVPPGIVVNASHEPSQTGHQQVGSQTAHKGTTVLKTGSNPEREGKVAGRPVDFLLAIGSKSEEKQALRTLRKGKGVTSGRMRKVKKPLDMGKPTNDADEPVRERKGPKTDTMRTISVKFSGLYDKDRLRQIARRRIVVVRQYMKIRLAIFLGSFLVRRAAPGVEHDIAHSVLDHILVLQLRAPEPVLFRVRVIASVLLAMHRLRGNLMFCRLIVQLGRAV